MADSITPILDAGLALFVDSNHVIVDEVRLESTPGHTPGHCALVVSSEGQEAVIPGDLIHHPVQVAIPHVRYNFCWTHDMERSPRRHVLVGVGDPSAPLLGSHFDVHP